MSKLRFALIGDGAIAKYHKKAIAHVGGELLGDHILDPKFNPNLPDQEFSPETCFALTSIYPNIETALNYTFNGFFDYIVICSPSHLHRMHIRKALDHSGSVQIICEKPAFLPWELPLDNDRINIVLQLRYLPNLPEKADLVRAIFVRDEEYFKTWKGDARKTGGLFFNLFIHYISLAIDLDADFEGMVLAEGEQEKWIGVDFKKAKHNFISEKANNEKVKQAERNKESYTSPLGEHFYIEGYGYVIDGIPYNIPDHLKKHRYENIIDILNVNMQDCYNRMYEDIIGGGGIKPKDIFYLSWILERNSEIFGYGKNSMNKLIRIGKELL